MNEAQLVAVKQAQDTMLRAQDRFDISPLEFQTECSYALQHLKKNSYLLKAAMSSRDSLLAAIGNCASVGLSLNPSEHLAYLIPRYDSDSKETRVYYEPSYMGLCKLATDSGAILWVQAEVFREGEEYIDNGIGQAPTHKKGNPFERPGKIIGAYCVAKTQSGDFLTETMTLEELISIRDRSELYKKAKKGPWVTDFAEQCKKTAIRRAFKRWPRSVGTDRMALAVDLSNDNEGFPEIPLTAPHIQEASAVNKERFDALIESGDALGMYTLQQELHKVSDRSFTNLYHSFAKGQKGKYQKIVDALLEEGFAKSMEYVEGMATAFTGGDESALMEMRTELSDEEWEVVSDQLPSDVVNHVGRST